MTWRKWRTGAGPASRRAFLGGAAAAVALPMFESLRRGAIAAPPVPPTRLMFWYVPNGIVMDQYRPPAEGPLPEVLPRILAPLAGVRSELNVITGLANPAAMSDIPGEHARGTGSWLTCVPIGPPNAPPRNGTSADRLAADAIGGQTPFASLDLGATGGSSVGLCHNGYSCAYTRNLSWLDEDTPNPKMTDPALVFDRLFGGSDPSLSAEEAALRRTWRTSVLDSVLEDAASLQSTLDAADQRKLDEYLTGVRELEVRLQSGDMGSCGTPERPGEAADYAAVCRAMNELAVLALECDLTRVVTFMMDDGGSQRAFDFLGIPEAHHDLSHHGGDVDKIEKLTQIEVWELGEFAWLLERMRGAVEADGSTLLDNSLVCMSSELSDGNLHLQQDLPVIVAGRGSGYIGETGQHLVFPGNPPIANLYLSLLEAVGVTPGGFGEHGTAPLDLG
jgi:hypothetical protein